MVTYADRGLRERRFIAGARPTSPFVCACPTSASSAFAKPGSGFMPGWGDVQKAFQDAFTAQIQGKTFNADPVTTATKAAIDKALAGG